MHVPQQYRAIIFGTIGAIVFLFALLGALIVLDQYKRSLPQESTETVNRIVSFETETLDDWEIFSNQQPLVIQQGIDGIVIETYKIVKSPTGEIISREKTEEVTSQQMQKKVIKQGKLDYETANAKIRERSLRFMEYFSKNDIASLYPMLTTNEKNKYPEESLRSIIKGIDYTVTSYNFTGSMSFDAEKEEGLLTGLQVASPSVDESSPVISPTPLVKASPKLVAKLPIEFVFTSKVTGSQKLTTTLYMLHEDQERWGVYYLGPTQHVGLDRTKTGDDGGKTINYPLSFEIILHDLLIFHNADALYFSYELNNTTKPSADLDRALQIKSEEMAQKTKVAQKPTTPTTPPAPTPLPPKVILRPDLEVTKATLRDDPGTNYTLVDRNIYDKAWATLPPGSTGKAWLKFSPAPSQKIPTFILDADVTIAGLWNTEISFGAIELN